mgnify:CR=1 FL=1
MVIFFYNPETPSNHFHVDLHIESWSFHSIHTAAVHLTSPHYCDSDHISKLLVVARSKYMQILLLRATYYQNFSEFLTGYREAKQGENFYLLSSHTGDLD